MKRNLLNSLIVLALSSTSLSAIAEIVVKAEPNSKHHPGKVVVNNKENQVHITRTITNKSDEYEMISYYADLILPNKDKRRIETYEATMSPNSTILPWHSYITVDEDMPDGRYQFVYAAVERSTGKVTEASFEFVKKTGDDFNVKAGPIWNQADAERKCPTATKHYGGWNGQWNTTVPNAMSVCGTNGGNDVDDPYAIKAGPIWNNADAHAKCRLATYWYGGWTGEWYTTDWGKMSVCIARDMVQN